MTATVSFVLDLSKLRTHTSVYKDRSPILGCWTDGWSVSLAVDSTDPGEHERAATELLTAAQEFADATALWVASARNATTEPVP